VVEGGEEAILEDLAWLGVDFEEGPLRQSERGPVYAAAAERALESGGGQRDDEGALRLGATTLVRPDGTATYQLASVVDDLELGITHIIRGSDHRPNLELHRRIARAVGGELPEVIHHGLVLGEDGKKLSKRHGHSSIAELREEGLPATAVRSYLDELDLPEHDVHLDLARLRRLAIDAIAAMPDEELAAAAEAPVEAVPVLRGARSLVEARAYARLILSPEPAELPDDAGATLERFGELRSAAPDRLDADGARAIVRELKAVGGDLRALRLALTGAATGPELAAVLAALPRDEALARARRA
jgi:glutamyl-tRNA synthetase